MTRELKAAIEDLKEGINLMSEAIITIVTKVAKVIDEEDIDIDSEEDLEGFVKKIFRDTRRRRPSRVRGNPGRKPCKLTRNTDN